MREKYRNRLLAMIFYFTCSVLLTFGFSGTAAAISFTNISGPGGTCNSGTPPGFCNDVGIDYSELTGNLVNSLFPNAGQAGPGGLFNVDRITGVHTPVANAPAGSVIDETKVATVRVAGPACNANQSFPVGTIFTGNGLPGQIVIIPPSGPSTTLLLQGTSVTLSGTITEDAVLRGGFFQDRFCAAGGDLFVVSGSGTPGAPVGGNVWRVYPTGTGTFTITHIVRIPNTAGTAGTRAHLEGVIVVPNDALIYGPWAGKIVTGDEDRTDVGSPVTAIINGTNPKIYAVDPTTGSVLSNGSGFTITGPVPHPEDFDFIEGDFYGNAYNNNGSDTTGTPKGAILRASFLDFDLTKGDILISQEYPQTPGDNSQISITRCVDVGANSGLYQFRWNGTSFVSTLLARSGTSPVLCQWEHVTFVPVSNITIEKTPDGNSFNIGDNIFFTIKVMSIGPGTATNVVLTDPLPTPGNLTTWAVDSVSFTGLVTPAPSNASCVVVGGNQLTCNFGSMATGATATVTVRTTTAGGANSAACTTNNGRVDNTAKVTADGPLSAQDTGFWTCTPPPPPGCPDGNCHIEVSGASLVGTDAKHSFKLSCLAGQPGQELQINMPQILVGGKTVGDVKFKTDIKVAGATTQNTCFNDPGVVPDDPSVQFNRIVGFTIGTLDKGVSGTYRADYAFRDGGKTFGVPNSDAGCYQVTALTGPSAGQVIFTSPVSPGSPPCALPSSLTLLDDGNQKAKPNAW